MAPRSERSNLALVCDQAVTRRNIRASTRLAIKSVSGKMEWCKARWPLPDIRETTLFRGDFDAQKFFFDGCNGCGRFAFEPGIGDNSSN
jgi:hypothetical protein